MDEDSPVAVLVRDAVEGDQAAWCGLVTRYAPLVLAVVRGYRLSEKDTEDVVQTLWLRLVEHLGELREPRALPKWIVTTTKHECLRIVTANKRTQAYDTLAETSPVNVADSGSLDEDLLQDERRTALLDAFADLPDHQRHLLLLLAEDPPPSYREISHRLSIPIGSIGPTRARALQRLRACPSIAALAGDPDTGTEGGDRHGTAVGR